MSYLYHDAQNRLIREDVKSVFLGAVHPGTSHRYSYSSAGARCEAYLAGKGSPWCRTWYNKQGLDVKIETYDNSKLISRALKYYNNRGDEVRCIMVQNKVVQHCTAYRNYHYDQHGNWTQRTEGKIVRRNGKDVFVTSQTVYRTFTYY